MPPISSTALKDFENRFRVSVQEDFATYLLTFGGMPLGSLDEELFRFWSFDEICPATEAMNLESYADYFTFADYSISALEYGVRLSKSAPNDVAIFGWHTPIIIAHSFTEFLMLYLSDPMSLLGPRRVPPG